MKPLWQPTLDDIAHSNVKRFMDEVQKRFSVTCTEYWELDRWSVEYPEEFWSLLWDFAGIIAEHKGEEILTGKDLMLGSVWFPHARLNFAENILRRRDDSPALIFWGEDKSKRTISFNEMYGIVSRLAQALRAQGITEGDRVAGFIPNMPEAIMMTLATASIGAVWSSCSPDFGVQGVVDRFGQIEPKLLISADGYYFNGKKVDCLQRLSEMQKQLPTLRNTVVIPYIEEHPSLSALTTAVLFDEFIAPYSEQPIDFAQLPFNHPLYVVFSSGTTGIPKCIVHSAGGALLQHSKEHLLHVDLKEEDRIFYHTTCGWMMWNWLLSALAIGATVLLYDGSPYYRKGTILFDYAHEERMTIFGTSAKYIETLMKSGFNPRESYALPNLRTMLSTGSPLSPEDFEYVYEKISPMVRLSSISGGTDIISCFVQGSPVLPVWRGEIQCRGLGQRVEVYNASGEAVTQEKGELVCTAPFPAMPVGFWNDPEGKKYHAAYFEKFPNVWCQGDYAEITEHHGFIIYGRSDTVLNPGGVRIGTAEIYRQVERIDEVVESLAVGQQWRNDTRTILFVKLREGVVLSESLNEKIKKIILQHTTMHHVPAKIVQVRDIPRTKNGKIVEAAVREIIHNRPIKNREALANPEILDEFKNRVELQD
jgi:acetoacetyl-CoA synthetase